MSIRFAPARRRLLRAAGAGLLGGWEGASSAERRPLPPASARVLVVGGGYAGATAAKYLRLLSGHRIDVVLVEPAAAFVSCPMSNLVLARAADIGSITVPYSGLARRHGVIVVRDRVTAIDAEQRTARLASGPAIRYDKLVLAPGVDMMWDEVAGLRQANADGRILQAWQAGPETLALRHQLQAMPDGGTFAIVVPEAPYRCPPAPYERACLVASYFKRAKRRAKVLVLDANEDLTSKGPLFRKAWAESYAGMIEYRPQSKAIAVDAARSVVKFDFQDDVRGDVLNVLPPMRAGAIAVQSGLANANARWCLVDFRTFESTAARHVHVLGDSIQIAPLMPKSGHMANSQAKVAAAAIVAELSGWPVDPEPMLSNTCYSFVDERRAAHIASVHRYQPSEQTFRTVPGAGGLSEEANEREARYAWGWARSIWADSLA